MIKTKSKTQTLATTKSGFTIIELMLAMTFVAMLLIAIAVVTINIVTIYQRGLSLKAVNNVGRSLIEELTTSINAAPAVDTTSLCNHLAAGSNPIYYSNPAECIQDNANAYVFDGRYDARDLQYSGVFCTGNYSYLWNTEYGLDANNRTLSLRYADKSDGATRTIDPEHARLLRIEDRTHRVCSSFLENFDANGNDNIGNWEIDITHEAKNESAINLIARPTDGYLNAFDLSLLIYEFTIQPISQDVITLRTYMTGNFILATERGGIDITASGDYCQNVDKDGNSTTSDLGNLGAEFNYCAINKFNFAARTAGV